VLDRARDLRGQGRRDALVGVDHQRPLGAHAREAGVSLGRVIGEGMESDLGSGGGCGLARSVGAFGVDDEHARRKAQRGDALRDLVGLVLGDDDGGEWEGADVGHGR
jgi:hypothetical protein